MTAIQRAMVAQCAQLQYRVAVLDTPLSVRPPLPLQPAQALGWLTQQGYSGPPARFAAVYYPWLRAPDELGIAGPNRTVPPCGHVAGAYAYTDNNSGVQKPPANVELQFISDVAVAVSNQQQGFLNPAGINAIRMFPGRGIRVWGARSIVQPSMDPNWIYIHTRRLMSMIENSVEHASRWVVFQTNDDNLRRMLTHSLNVFLNTIWLAGGLQGARPSEGYFVKCDRTNNPQSSIDAGQLICQVGVAIAAPMEFLVFEMRRSVAGAQVVEA
jgi:phage tail sheath protein FI